MVALGRLIKALCSNRDNTLVTRQTRKRISSARRQAMTDDVRAHAYADHDSARALDIVST